VRGRASARECDRRRAQKALAEPAFSIFLWHASRILGNPQPRRPSMRTPHLAVLGSLLLYACAPSSDAARSGADGAALSALVDGAPSAYRPAVAMTIGTPAQYDADLAACRLRGQNALAGHSFRPPLRSPSSQEDADFLILIGQDGPERFLDRCMVERGYRLLAPPPGPR
jgi:hypothetical protein